MADSRIPEIPLPRPFLRVISEAPVTKEDVERVRKTLQQNIDVLQAELRREKELTQKLQKSGEVLQEILSAPDFRALSLQSRETLVIADVNKPGAAHADEPPVEYVEVEEIELTDHEVTSLEGSTAPGQKKAEV
ncbi:MAG: hypothetical protein ACOY5B_04245 [Spirochaetota bacterium]